MLTNRIEVQRCTRMQMMQSSFACLEFCLDTMEARGETIDGLDELRFQLQQMKEYAIEKDRGDNKAYERFSSYFEPFRLQGIGLFSLCTQAAFFCFCRKGQYDSNFIRFNSFLHGIVTRLSGLPRIDPRADKLNIERKEVEFQVTQITASYFGIE